MNVAEALKGRGYIILSGAKDNVLSTLGMVGMLNGQAPSNMHVLIFGP